MQSLHELRPFTLLNLYKPFHYIFQNPLVVTSVYTALQLKQKEDSAFPNQVAVDHYTRLQRK